MSINTGGPAFPNTLKITDENYAELRGMTLRDYFAAKAMQAAIQLPETNNYDEKAVCKFAYIMADAMIEARGQE